MTLEEAKAYPMSVGVSKGKALREVPKGELLQARYLLSYEAAPSDFQTAVELVCTGQED